MVPEDEEELRGAMAMAHVAGAPEHGVASNRVAPLQSIHDVASPMDQVVAGTDPELAVREAHPIADLYASHRVSQSTSAAPTGDPYIDNLR